MISVNLRLAISTVLGAIFPYLIALGRQCDAVEFYAVAIVVEMPGIFRDFSGARQVIGVLHPGQLKHSFSKYRH